MRPDLTKNLTSKPHYPILDGLRGVAALIVVTFHLAEPFSTGNLDKFVNHGYLAVDFFFLLSGFVIGYGYDDRWHKTTVGTFFKRRIERLQLVTNPTRIKNAFLWFSLLVIIVLYMPRIGGAEHLWMNGIYDSVCIIIVFPIIVYLGASGVMQSQKENKICKFLGDISYPLYMVHYPLVYLYVAWVSNYKGVTIIQALPYALLIFIGGVVLAYAALKWYDEPVRKWVQKRLA